MTRLAPYPSLSFANTIRGRRRLENHAAETALNYVAYNFIKIHRTLRMSPAMAAGVTDRLWEVNDLVALWGASERRAESGNSGVIYVKCTLAGLLAVLAATVLLVIVVVVGISIATRSLQSSQSGSIGWDPISLAGPFTWLVVVLGIFLIGFFWEFYRVRSK